MLTARKFKRHIPKLRSHDLSSREIEIVLAFIESNTNEEIALKTNINCATVRNHLWRITNKLKLKHRNRTELRLFLEDLTKTKRKKKEEPVQAPLEVPSEP